MLDWNDLKFILALARHGSLSAAAEELHVAQSTMGGRLASLEASLGVRLLTRTPDGYVPTLAGISVREHEERLEAEALCLERCIGGRDTRMAGLVRVSRGFVYQAAVMDWFSRRVLAWRLSITLDVGFSPGRGGSGWTSTETSGQDGCGIAAVGEQQQPGVDLTYATLIVHVDAEEDDTSSEQDEAKGAVGDVADYLSRHGVAAAGETRLLREGSIPAELLLAAEQRGAELVVAGGYAHSRFQEWVFGGLPRALLGHFPKCCLLSH